MYNAEKRVVVLESNATLLNELKGAIERQGNFIVAYTGDDGENGVKQIVNSKPDIVIVGTFLKGLDGCNVIREIKAAGLQSKIIATGVSGEAVIERAIREGADYYLIKPFAIQGALELMSELCEEKGNAATETTEVLPQKRRATSLEEKISDIFISIGIPPHIKGYAYLREGIKMTVKQPRIINNVTKELYPGVAEIYKTTSSKSGTCHQACDRSGMEPRENRRDKRRFRHARVSRQRKTDEQRIHRAGGGQADS